MEVDGHSKNNIRLLEISPNAPHGPPSKMPREDVVALAQQLHEANNFVQANACNKLKPIVDQMKFLRQQAISVLESAQRDQKLHEVQCSFRKAPGQIYHLYEKSTGKQYFSMLSPQEWGSQAPDQKHIGSFRLEADQSWTPEYEITRRDQDILTLRNLMAAGQAATSTGAGSLCLQQGSPHLSLPASAFVSMMDANSWNSTSKVESG
ncbi:uncharacterized protein C08B11.9-like isoform X2 [Varroa jacobsoni]|uniref:DUF2452 domain-containing protein n=1 Tax=Varroa destructor TaxID=109461 RepID=A0A7M7KT53_VARDE|nr:uncharacterized protein C08B11.9-like isoform X1 [Varroa destructor]XP_022698200.1 uncharacterized protein C08B11.9-like isoform X2 [Varroa jacobsoni]